MFTFLSSVLLKLPPETAHSFAILLLKTYQFIKAFFRIQIKAGTLLIQIPPKHELKLRSRLGLAAGFDKNAEVFPALLHLGFGFVEIGTVTPLSQEGNARPRVFRVAPGALVNHMGFNNVGLKAFKDNIERLQVGMRTPVFANIGKNKSTPLDLAVKDYELGIQFLRGVVSGFVINISSPNTPGLRDLQNVSFLKSLESILPTDKPTFIKLSPDLSLEEFDELCQFVLESKTMSGVVLTNTSRFQSDRRGFSQGGLSGPPLFATSLSWIERASKLFRGKKIIIGVGGVSSLEDALKMKDAGADLVELYTAFIYQGPKIVKEITKSF